MKVVRAIRKEDLDGLKYLSTHVGGGMTSLKPDAAMLSKRIDIACASFAEQIPIEQRDYLFVLEETESSELIGVCAIKGAVGLEEPFYNYRIGMLVHTSKELNVNVRMDTLNLSNDLTGCSELCSLFLHPKHRTGTNGKLLSKSRFLFIAQFPHLFNEKLIAELRGYQRPDGSSPFWDNLGRHFFQMEFHLADDLSIVGKKSFIAELMPRHPLYVAYLSKEAQDAIGKVHVETEPARRLLVEEGLYYEGYVDIFDAGPVLQARVNELRSTRSSEVAEVVDASSDDDFTNALMKEPIHLPTLISNTTMQDFRVIVGEIAPDRGQLLLTNEEQQVLRVAPESHVRTMPLTSDRK